MSLASPGCTQSVCLQFYCQQQIMITSFKRDFLIYMAFCTLTLYQSSVSVSHTHNLWGWWSRPLVVFSCCYSLLSQRQLYSLSSGSYYNTPSITAKYTHRQKDCKTHSVSSVAISVLLFTHTTHWFIQCPLYRKIALFNVPQEIGFISRRSEWIEERVALPK